MCVCVCVCVFRNTCHAKEDVLAGCQTTLKNLQVRGILLTDTTLYMYCMYVYTCMYVRTCVQYVKKHEMCKTVSVADLK